MKTSSKMPININQAHLWLIYPDMITDPDILKSFHAILSDEEQEQHRKFVFEKDRYIYLVAHAFVRFCLSQYAEVEPAEWIFRKNRYGKPYTDHCINGLPLKYNLSHTHGLIACIVTLQHEVGVDVERIVQDESRIEIAESYFSDIEYDVLAALSFDDQNRRFYDYWTLKEAYIKAKGAGLSIPLDSFVFNFNGVAPIQISFRDNLHDNPHRWNFYLYEFERKHICAVAIECDDIPVELIIKDGKLE